MSACGQRPATPMPGAWPVAGMPGTTSSAWCPLHQQPTKSPGVAAKARSVIITERVASWFASVKPSNANIFTCMPRGQKYGPRHASAAPPRPQSTRTSTVMQRPRINLTPRPPVLNSCPRIQGFGSKRHVHEQMEAFPLALSAIGKALGYSYRKRKTPAW